MKGGIPDEQFGFRKAKSTVDTINHEDKCCAVVTLDVKSAFNCAKWKNIMEELVKLQSLIYIYPTHCVEFLLD